MNVSLEGFNKSIKRKISVDSNYSIDPFCRKVIICMNGDLDHMYGVKIGKEFLDIENKESDLSCLELKEKQKFKVIYDFGDNWIFNVTVSKIVENYGVKKFYLIDGKGKGIIEDCGGIRGLFNIYTSDYGICDVDKINMLIDNVL